MTFENYAVEGGQTVSTWIVKGAAAWWPELFSLNNFWDDY